MLARRGVGCVRRLPLRRVVRHCDPSPAAAVIDKPFKLLADAGLDRVVDDR
jgi:hypothetical protein